MADQKTLMVEITSHNIEKDLKKIWKEVVAI